MKNLILIGVCLMGLWACESTSERESFKWGYYTLSDKDLWLDLSAQRMADDPFAAEMRDAYNSFQWLYNIWCDAELWDRYEIPVQDTIRHAGCPIIRDDSVRAAAQAYQQEMLRLLEADTLTIPDSVRWKLEVKARNQFYGTLVERYHSSHYVDLNDEQYWAAYDKNNVVPNYDSIQSLRGSNAKSTVDYLHSLAKQAENFDARCIYTIELAHVDSLPLYKTKCSMLEQLMNEKRYSVYLREVWRVWRCLTQQGNGYSKDSSIPNEYYNKMRRICAMTILDYVRDHPKDVMAINQFIILSAQPNIERDGYYPYGNQIALEEQELFPELFDDGGEE